MSSTCSFHLDKPDIAFMSNEILTGALHLTTKELKKNIKIVLYFRGVGRVSFTDTNNHTLHGRVLRLQKHYQGTYPYCELCYPQHEGDLEIGTHRYTFSIVIPENCETSCTKKDGRNCNELVLAIERNNATEETFNFSISVIQTFDLNLHFPLLSIGTEKVGSPTRCCFPCVSQNFEWDVRLRYTGVIPGQDIHYAVKICNESRTKNVKGFEVSLQQTYRFSSQSPPGTTRTIVSEIYDIKVIKKVRPSTSSIINGYLTIAEALPPSNPTNNIISVYYTLFFKIRSINCKKDSIIEIPIQIGTIPLVNTFPAFDKQKIEPSFHDDVRFHRFVELIGDEGRIVDDFVPKYPLFLQMPRIPPPPPESSPSLSSTSSDNTNILKKERPTQLNLVNVALPCTPNTASLEEPVASTSAAAKHLLNTEPAPLKFESSSLLQTTTGIKFLNIDSPMNPMNSSLAISSASTEIPGILSIEEPTVPSACLPEEGNTGTTVVDIEWNPPSSGMRSVSTECVKSFLLEDPSGSSPILIKASTSCATTPASTSATPISADNIKEPGPTLPKNVSLTLEEATTPGVETIINVDQNDPSTRGYEAPSPSTNTFNTPLFEMPSEPLPFLPEASTSDTTIYIDNTDDSESAASKNVSLTLEEATTPGVETIINIDQNDPLTRSDDVSTPSTNTFNTPLFEMPTEPLPFLPEASTSDTTISIDNTDDSESAASKNASLTLEEATPGVEAIINIDQYDPLTRSDDVSTPSTNTFNTPLFEMPTEPLPFLPEGSTSDTSKSIDNTDDSESVAPKNVSPILEEAPPGVETISNINQNDPVTRSYEVPNPSTNTFEMPSEPEASTSATTKSIDNTDDSESVAPKNDSQS